MRALVLLPFVLIIAMAIIIKAIIDNRRPAKWNGNENAEGDVVYSPKRQVLSGLYGNLKWGFIMAGIGLALLIREFVLPDIEDPGTFGLMFFCAGCGFIIYYFIARQGIYRMDDNEKSNRPSSKKNQS